MKTLIITALMAFSFAALAEKPSYEIRYTKTGDTLDSIATRFLPDVKIKYANNLEAYKADLVKWNPSIKDWNNIKKLTPLYIDYPYTVFAPTSYAPPITEIQLEDEDSEESGTTFFGIAYTASAGQFSETTNQQSVKSSQNSPISLGINGGYNIHQREHSLLGSFYWSKLTAGKIEGNLSSTSTKISTPSEIGGNVYYQYHLTDYGFMLYTGVDYEKFGTFNTKELTQGDTLQTRSNTLVYGTLGVGKVISLSTYNLLTKFSFASSLSSKTDAAVSTDTFKGSRMLVFLNLKQKGENFGFHLLYKRHSLTGPTELTINRMGVGVNYTF